MLGKRVFTKTPYVGNNETRAERYWSKDISNPNMGRLSGPLSLSLLLPLLTFLLLCIFQINNFGKSHQSHITRLLQALASLSILCWSNGLFPWDMSHSGFYRESKHRGDDSLDWVFETWHMKLIHVISSNTRVGPSEHSASPTFLYQINSGSSGQVCTCIYQKKRLPPLQVRVTGGPGFMVICWNVVNATVWLPSGTFKLHVLETGRINNDTTASLAARNMKSHAQPSTEVWQTRQNNLLWYRLSPLLSSLN